MNNDSSQQCFKLRSTILNQSSKPNFKLHYKQSLIYYTDQNTIAKATSFSMHNLFGAMSLCQLDCEFNYPYENNFGNLIISSHQEENKSKQKYDQRLIISKEGRIRSKDCFWPQDSQKSINVVRIDSYGLIQEDQGRPQKIQIHPLYFPQNQPVRTLKKEKEKSYQKWRPQHKKKFWLAYAEMFIKKTVHNLSWKYWKDDGFFQLIEKKMKTKDCGQIKSFDQRMKKRYYIKDNMDIDEVIPKALQNFTLESEQQNILKKFLKISKNMKEFGFSNQNEEEDTYIKFMIKDTKEQKDSLPQIDSILDSLSATQSCEFKRQAPSVCFSQ